MSTECDVRSANDDPAAPASRGAQSYPDEVDSPFVLRGGAIFLVAQVSLELRLITS